jgi:hypothetical protein
MVDKKAVQKHATCSLLLNRTFQPNERAMLAALRIVLDLPRQPISLKEEDNLQETG